MPTGPVLTAIVLWAREAPITNTASHICLRCLFYQKTWMDYQARFPVHNKQASRYQVPTPLSRATWHCKQQCQNRTLKTNSEIKLCLIAGTPNMPCFYPTNPERACFIVWYFSRFILIYILFNGHSCILRHAPLGNLQHFIINIASCQFLYCLVNITLILKLQAFDWIPTKSDDQGIKCHLKIKCNILPMNNSEHQGTVECNRKTSPYHLQASASECMSQCILLPVVMGIKLHVFYCTMNTIISV